jgi:signal transduction histidine kinase
VTAVAVTLAADAVALTVASVDHHSVLSESFDAAVTIAFAIVGAVVAGARPRNPVGWLMLGGGAFWAMGSAFSDLGHHGIVINPGSVAGVSAYVITGAICRSVGWYAITNAVPVFFPDGQLAGPRWRWLRPALVVIVIGCIVDPLTDPQADTTGLGHWRNPIGHGLASRFVSPLASLAHIPLSFVVTIAAVSQLVIRWRRGDSLLRQQILLFACAAALPIVAVPLAFTTSWGSWVFGVSAVPLPFAIGFAVLAKGLYDLRSAANRTLVWLTLSVCVAGLYAALIVGLSHLLDVNSGSGWLPWVAAGVVAVSVAPLRDVLQRTVNRITFGRWDEPYAVLAEVGQRLEDTVDVTRLLSDLASELESLGLRDVTIADASGVPLVGGAAVHDDLIEQQLSAYGEVVGALTYQPPTAGLRSRDARLLDDLAGHLGGVLYAHRLTIDLQGARERLVLAREEERRRLRRDLHDGLGPALAGHLLRLDVLAAKVRGDDAAASYVDEMRAELRGTVDEIRRVVEGLRPPALDDLGLVGALEQVGNRISRSSRMQVEVDAAKLPTLPAAVEVATFRIVTEAVTNAVKHSAAAHCTVTMSAEDGRLRIAVSDDGCGIPKGSAAQGHGLHTMRERAEELRGRLSVTAGPGGGTVVEATLPLPHRHDLAAPRVEVAG